MFAAAVLTAAVMEMGLGGCTPRAPEAPPPAAPPPPPAPSPELMGGPPEPPPAAAEQPGREPDAAMAPIANPEDMSPEERAQVYGHRYDYLDRAAGRRRVHGTIGGEADEQPSVVHHRHGRHETAGERVDHERWSARRGHRHVHAKGHGATDHGAKTGTPNASPAAKVPPSAAPPGSAASPPVANPPSGAPPATAQSPASRVAPAPGFNLDWLSLPGAPYVHLIGFGRVASKYIVATSLLIIAVVLLAFAAYRNRGARPARRPPVNTIGAGPRFADEMPREPPAP
jgi:hypothetical protein